MHHERNEEKRTAATRNMNIVPLSRLGRGDLATERLALNAPASGPNVRWPRSTSLGAQSQGSVRIRGIYVVYRFTR